MRCLVTGATGFLGGHLVAELGRRGHAVLAAGRDPQKCAALEAQGFETVAADLTDASAAARVCDGAEVVFHVAALAAPWGPYADFHAANVTATENVVRACIERGVRRLVHVSSASVIFDTRHDQMDADERQPYPSQYLSFYSLTKKLAEDAVNQAGGLLDAVILRPKAIFGPGDTALLPRLFDAARRKRLRQIGDGSNLLDMTYVVNVVDAMLLAAESPTARGRTYHVTNGERFALWPFLKRVLAAARFPADLKSVPYPIAYGSAAIMEWMARVTANEPQLTRYAVASLGRTQTYSIQAAQRDLGYAPRISIEEGLDLTIQGFRE
jgi:nucleoside-diphosphate-sugar epimerase